MFGISKSKKNEIDPKQKELFEHAQSRIKEKKRLYNHFIFFLVGCIFIIVLNLGLNIGSQFRFFELDWFVYVILAWSFFLVIHLFKVVLFSKFMGKEWKAKQLAYLVEKQKNKIAKMEKKMDLETPKPIASEKTIILDNTKNNNEDPQILQ